MMDDKQLITQRLEELLADRALFGLTEKEQSELNALQSRSHLDVDPDAFDRAVTVAAISFLDGSAGPLPNQLKQKIAQSFAGTSAPSGKCESIVAEAHVLEVEHEPVELRSRPSKVNRREWLAWTAAAASAGFLAADRFGWLSAWKSSPSLADARDQLLRSAPDIASSTFKITADPSAREAVGDVVWSSTLQQGFIRLRGLPPNEPYVHQYQAWIFDSKQDDRYPIDGGTFDVASKRDESIITLRPRLPVVDPWMVAVTLEKRGGVVVSKRERMMLVAEFKAKQA